MATAAPAPRPPKVAIDILTGPQRYRYGGEMRNRYKYEACFFLTYDLEKFLKECPDDKLFWDFKELEADGQSTTSFTTDELRANPFFRSWISGMLDHAKFFDPIEYAETFMDVDMASKQRQFPQNPLDATHHIHLIDSNWEKDHDDNIAKIRKWVQVMVFNADESESDDCLGEEDRELAYIEEKEEIAAYLKNQREEARAARRQSYMRNMAHR